MSQIVNFKRGSTFNPKLTLPATGTFTSLAGVGVTSSVVTSDGKTYNAIVTIPDENGRIFWLRIEDTRKWVTGDAIWDVKFYLNGNYVYTKTTILRVIRSATP
jgi:hypothetical protein